MTRRLIGLAVTVLAFVSVGFAQTAVDEFERGNALYREGDFEQAAAVYESILKQGITSASIYYNLGNSYYRLGKVAPAILSFERALRLQPNDPDIKHNLSLVNLKTVDRIEALPDVFFVEWLRSISAVVPLHTTVWAFVAAWTLLFSGLIVLFLSGRASLVKPARLAVVAAFVALVPLTVLMIAQIADSRSHDDAIVTAGVVTAKTSPDERGVDAFVVHEGLKVSLSDHLSGWVKIVLADGKVGWIRSNNCERI